MKRDLDLIRSLLFAVEKNEDPTAMLDPKIEGYNELQISYHIMLMDDAGLLKGTDRTAIGVFRWSASHLTWAGHELLDAARKDEIWKEVMAKVDASGDNVPFDLLKKLLLETGEKHLRGGAAKAS
ncbi:MAG: DUF2513 domain-containing protein [Gammaproteobacteria bacterium]|nr:DUF2513 domain-containing protein [Gammaproteobacteria bacterium]